MEVRCRNVNDAFFKLVRMFAGYTQDLDLIKKPYSNPNGSGVRTQMPEPVMVHYSRPKERVLFNKARDCNPFLHLYEALWMLAGRNDVAPLAYYAKQMGEYSDDGRTLNGAYGYRWRRMPYDRPEIKHLDQLSWLIRHLKAKPDSSRAVLAMWNVENDLLKIDKSKDVSCNLDVVFSIRMGEKWPDAVPGQGPCWLFLDMTVFNRSNDLIWGALGTNYVHFTVLQEYVAAHLGVEVGRYTQATTNLHTYDWNFKPQEYLEEYDDTVSTDNYEWYNKRDRGLVPLVKHPATFDAELPRLVEQFSHTEGSKEWQPGYEEPFFEEVAAPMFQAFRLYKHKLMDDAVARIGAVKADDWREAALTWLRKRVK